LDLGPEESDAGLFALDAEGRLLAFVVIERSGDIWLTEIAAD
jgi:hypothetical protein